MLGAGYLTEHIKITKVADHTTAGTGDVTCTSVDMAEDGGYDGVAFITSYGTANANNILKAAGSDDDSTFAEYASAAQIASGTSDEDVALDIQRPLQRYVKAVPERGTSSTLESVWAIRYRSRTRPVTSHAVSGTSAIKQASSPANA
jgi:hypothetical protein